MGLLAGAGRSCFRPYCDNPPSGATSAPEGATRTKSRREHRSRRLFGAGGWVMAGISSEVGPPAPFSRRRVRCRSDCVREPPPGAKMTPEQGLAKQSRTRVPSRRRRGDGLAPTRVHARHPVHKNRGCRSKFWVPLSITSQVPFPYLRLRKKLEPSYSAIRPKRTGKRDFCAGAPEGGYYDRFWNLRNGLAQEIGAVGRAKRWPGDFPKKFFLAGVLRDLAPPGRGC